MKIQLDTNAMNAMFPAGSEARVELQGAVVANFAKRMNEKLLDNELYKAIHSGIREPINSERIRQEISGAIRKEFDNINSYSTSWGQSCTVKEAGNIKKAMQNLATAAVERAMNSLTKTAEQLVQETVDTAFEKLQSRINLKMVDVLRTMEKRCEQKIEAKMDELVRMAFTKMIQGSLPIGG